MSGTLWNTPAHPQPEIPGMRELASIEDLAEVIRALGPLEPDEDDEQLKAFSVKVSPSILFEPA